MSTNEGLQYEPAMDRVEGFEDMGVDWRTKYTADHAMLVMARGSTGQWKRPLGYFTTSGPMSAVITKDVIFQAVDKLITP